jgi:heme/copper-type cytochrome/quinol oxidase subunit 2
VLAAFAVVLAAAFVVAPGTLAASRPGGGFADQLSLVDTLGKAFVEYWRSGDRDLSPSLERVVDYWFRYHVAKAVIAAILLIVLVALGVLLWRAFLRAGALGAGRRAALASAGVLVTMPALFSLVVVMANVQGAVAPFASLLSLLPVGASGGVLADTFDQVRQRLAESAGAGHRTPPALEVMISDYALYHVTLVVIGSIVAVVLIGMSIVLWRRSARTGSSDRRTRRVLRSFGVLSTVLSLIMIVVVVANMTNVADPAPALLALFDGGR